MYCDLTMWWVRQTVERRRDDDRTQEERGGAGERASEWERGAECNYMLILWLCCEWWRAPFYHLTAFLLSGFFSAAITAHLPLPTCLSLSLSLSLSLPLSLLCGTQQLSFINCPLLPPAGHSVITEDELSPDIPAAVEIFGTTFSTVQKWSLLS